MHEMAMPSLRSSVFFRFWHAGMLDGKIVFSVSLDDVESTPVKIVLQHRVTKLFWGRCGWTGCEDDAVYFGTALSAFTFSQGHCLGDTEAIFRTVSATPLLNVAEDVSGVDQIRTPL